MTDRAPTRASVVIPAYDEGRRLPAVLRDLVERLGGLHDVTLETVVVDDGSRTDDSARVREAIERGARTLSARRGAHTLRFARAPVNGGKGSAIRLGWTHADPDAAWLGWVDGDGAVTAAELLRVVGRLLHNDLTGFIFPDHSGHASEVRWPVDLNSSAPTIGRFHAHEQR
jgi:dolichyl-phosphate beta-glucosyltransferase